MTEQVQGTGDMMGTGEAADSVTKGCLWCKTVIESYSGDENIRIFLSTNVEQISKKDKDEFLTAVNVLLNSSGGLILIHADDLHHLDTFDKQVDDAVELLIPDHALFHERFCRTILDDNHIIFRVTPTNGVRPLSSFELFSETSRDAGLKPATFSQLNRIVTTQNDSVQDVEMRVSIDDGGEALLNGWPFQENVRVQAKDVDRKDHNDLNSVRKLFPKLKKYITAFSKIHNGGLYCIGLPEKTEKEKSKPDKTTFTCRGFSLKEEERNILKRSIETLGKEILWCGPRKPDNPVVADIKDFKDSSGQTKWYVVVKINYYRGVCFYETPKAYKWPTEEFSKDDPGPEPNSSAYPATSQSCKMEEELEDEWQCFEIETNTHPLITPVQVGGMDAVRVDFREWTKLCFGLH